MTKKAKAQAPVTPIQDPREAEDRANRGVVLGLLQGKTAPADIAQVIFDNPRYEQAIMAFVADLGSNAAVNAVYDELDKLESTQTRPADHVGGIKDLGRLSGNTQPVQETDKTSGGERLPYDGRGGWDAVLINTQLRQYDLLAGTDNDGWRCGFATVLAAKVFQGPGAFGNWLTAFQRQNGIPGQGKTPTQVAASNVMAAVGTAIAAGTATYRDLSWLMEALYDYVVTAQNEANKDNPWYTPQQGILTTKQVYTPATDSLDTTMEGLSQGPHKGAKNVVDAAKAVPPGENIMIEWGCTKVSDGKRLDHELMISNQGGTLYIFDASAPMGLNLRPLTVPNLQPYFDEANYQHSTMTFAGTLKPVIPK